MTGDEKKSCFVVMGFHTKTAYYSKGEPRSLNLDATYHGIIKPAVEAAGLTCIRADEIDHSGSIDVPMYEQLLKADIVVADLSTTNANAMYELGVRHALRPFSTILIAEDRFEIPFDINHVATLPYKHLGEDIGVAEARRFSSLLEEKIRAIVGGEQVDSPVYTFLDILPPDVARAREREPGSTRGDAGPAAGDEEHTGKSVAQLKAELRAANEAEDFAAAAECFAALREKDPSEVWFVQQHALTTYKAEQPDALSALFAAKTILSELAPDTTADPETIGLWGAIHKRLWTKTKERSFLDVSIHSYERGFNVKSDFYNGVNFAFMLDCRASEEDDEDEATADRIQAKRTRKRVVEICERLDAELGDGEVAPEHYWVLATLWECCFALGDEAKAKEWEARARELPGSKTWMVKSTEDQIRALGEVLGS